VLEQVGAYWGMRREQILRCQDVAKIYSLTNLRFLFVEI